MSRAQRSVGWARLARPDVIFRHAILNNNRRARMGPSYGERFLKSGPKFFHGFRPDAHTQQPAGDAAGLDKLQFRIVRQDRVRTTEREVRPEIRALADLQMVKEHGRRILRIPKHNRHQSSVATIIALQVAGTC